MKSLRVRSLELHEQILEQLRRGDFETALHGLRHLLMILPATSKRRRADALTVTAFAALQTGRTSEAIDIAERALAIVPDHPLALSTLKDAQAKRAA